MPPYAQAAQTNLLTLIQKYPDSVQAHAIWDAMVNGTTHIQVDAYAGTGKTFTAMEGIRPIASSRSIQYLCFNKPIQVEANDKIPKPARASTFNSAGFGACLNQWPFLRGNDHAVNPDRTWEMLPDNMPTATKSLITRLVALCKNTLSPTDRNSLLDLAADYDIDLYESESDDTADIVLSLVPEILEQSKTPTICIDFNDQVWLPVVWQLPVRQYDLVVIDEEQDLNNARMALALMMIRPPKPNGQGGGRLMGIGDIRQAIYGFAGSNHKSMSEMSEALAKQPQGLVTLKLSVTRRCPKVVTALARQIVPDFECLPDAPLGFLCMGTHQLVLDQPAPNYNLRRVNFAPTKETLHNHPQSEECDPLPLGLECETIEIPGSCPSPDPMRGDMVLCRTNGPAVQLAYKLIRQNVPVKIQGKEIGQDLEKLIKKWVPSNGTISQLLDAAARYREKEEIKIARNPPNRAATLQAALDDRLMCIEALTDGLTYVSEVLSRISVLFQDVKKGQAENFVLISSIHKAKGLESQVVRIIKPELIPHPMARLTWQQEQEMNLKYVAITRSLHTLHIH